MMTRHNKFYLLFFCTILMLLGSGLSLVHFSISDNFILRKFVCSLVATLLLGTFPAAMFYVVITKKHLRLIDDQNPSAGEKIVFMKRSIRVLLFFVGAFFILFNLSLRVDSATSEKFMLWDFLSLLVNVVYGVMFAVLLGLEAIEKEDSNLLLFRIKKVTEVAK